MKNKILQLAFSGAVSGVTIGLIISIIISISTGTGEYLPGTAEFMTRFTDETTAMLASVLIWAAIGVLFSISSLIFSDTNLSIINMTLIHFIITYVAFSSLAFYAAWFNFADSRFISFSITYIIIYIVMYVINMFRYKKYIDEINSKLKN